MKLSIAKDELQFGHKQSLNKDFWQNEKLNSEVRVAIRAIIKNFLKTTNLEITVDEVDEIEFTGSLANYNYGKFSDVDVHLLFDFSKIGDDKEFLRDYLVTKAISWNKRHNVTIFGHEVELYITNIDSDHHSTGVYSVKNNKWLVKPVRDTKLSAKLNLNKVKDKADKISKEIDMLASTEGDLSVETIEGLKDKIKKMRVAGLEEAGEFSTENLAFKLLRRRGELNTLYALMNQAQDAELSLDEDVEWWKKRRKLDNKNYKELIGHGRGRRGAKKNKKGSPYMMNPPRRLPKSAPPGIAENLQEQYSQDTLDMLNKIESKLDAGESVEMKLDSMTISGYKCLNSHSYMLKKSNNEYSIKLKQSIDSVTTGQAKALQDVSDYNVEEECVYGGGDAIIPSVELRNIILDELSDGNAEFVFEAPKLPTFQLPDFELPDIFGSSTKESLFSKKIKKEPAGVLLNAIPLKNAYFINLENIKFSNIDFGKILGDPMAEVEKLFEALAGSIKNIIYYSKGKSAAIFFKPNRKDQVNSSRNIPTGDLDKTIARAIKEAFSKDPNLKKLPDAIKNTLIKTVTGLVSVRKILSPFTTVINFSTVNVFLEKLDSESDSDICKLFDCKKSTIKKKWAKQGISGVKYEPNKKLLGTASLINYLYGFDSGYKAPKTSVVNELNTFLMKLEQNTPASLRKTKNPASTGLTNKYKSKIRYFRRTMDEGVLNALLYMKKQMINDKVPGAETFGVKSAFRSDATQYKIFNAYLNRKRYGAKGKKVLFKKKYCEETDSKKRSRIFRAARTWSAPPKGVHNFIVKCGEFGKPDIKGRVSGKGSPHRTGRAVDFNFSAIDSNEKSLEKDQSNPIYKWLEKNAGMFGFIPYPKEPWHWEMSPENADKWKEFGKPPEPSKE